MSRTFSTGARNSAANALPAACRSARCRLFTTERRVSPETDDIADRSREREALCVPSPFPRPALPDVNPMSSPRQTSAETPGTPGAQVKLADPSLPVPSSSAGRDGPPVHREVVARWATLPTIAGPCARDFPRIGHALPDPFVRQVPEAHVRVAAQDASFTPRFEMQPRHASICSLLPRPALRHPTSLSIVSCYLRVPGRRSASSFLQRVLHAREDRKKLAGKRRRNMQVSKHVIHRCSTDQDTRASAEASLRPGTVVPGDSTRLRAPGWHRTRP